MRNDEYDSFSAMIDATYDLIGVGPAKIISPVAKALFFDDLKRFPLDLIKNALAAHRQDADRGKFTPKPADIIHQIELRLPVVWLDANEAWARMPKTEAESAMLCNETAEALAIAQPMLDAGEESAARLAFRGAYTRLAEKAKIERRAPVYFFTQGTDKAQRGEVLAKAVSAGLIGVDQALAILPMEADRIRHAADVTGQPLLSAPSRSGQAKVAALLAIKKFGKEGIES